MGLAEKFFEIAHNVRPIAKAGSSEFFERGYVSKTKLIGGIKPILLAKGALVLPQLKEHEREGELTTVVLEIKLLDVETNEAMCFTWAGQGVDRGDKGSYKAYTGTLKHFFLKTFLIPTKSEEDSSEKQHSTEVVKQGAQRQQAELEEPATSNQNQVRKKAP
ncbi:MAG: ERF family protein [Archaeoglobaceae archaeon]